jgi:uncharacterized membrane protein (DUF2068 family)
VLRSSAIATVTTSVPTGPARSPSAQRHTLDPLRVIALFKFFKAALLIATGYGVHLLLKESLLLRLHEWTMTLTDSFAQRLLLQALSWVEGLGAKRIHIVMAVTLAYTAVVLTEGIGLWLRRAWGEWVTVVATASLIPFELWELIVRPPNRKLAVLGTVIVNVTIVWYLSRLIRRQAAERAGWRAADTQTSRRSTG